MKKKILIALMALVGLGTTAMADNNASETNGSANTRSEATQSNKKLQFTVSPRDNGKINTSGNTENFCIMLAGGLSPLDKNVSVTVEIRQIDEYGRVSFFGGDARRPYVIPAGKFTSDNAYVKIGTNYAGKKYIVKIIDYLYNGKRVMVP